MLYGITHSLSGAPMTRLVRMLKVGIGYPKGPAIHVYINAKREWVVEIGVNKEAQRKGFSSRGEAKQFYDANRRGAPERKYPGKFPYFTFQRVGIDGSFSPDWDAIEEHGPLPTEVPIVFLTNDPLEQAMQWWTAAELKCEGNGRDARRRIDLAKSDAEKAAAKRAADSGDKFFPIVDGCFARGCMYARGDKPVCKPHTRLNFQLANAPALGATCTFDSTGFRSGANLFSSLDQIRTITGRGNPEDGVVAGIPLLLVLRPYKTSHNGQPSTQYGVSLQLRAEDAVRLYQKVLQAGDEFRAIAGAPLQLTATPEFIEESGERVTEKAEAMAMDAEFYSTEDAPDGEWDEFHGSEQSHNPEPPKQATPRRKSEAAKQESLIDPDSDEAIRRQNAELLAKEREKETQNA